MMSKETLNIGDQVEILRAAGKDEALMRTATLVRLVNRSSSSSSPASKSSAKPQRAQQAPAAPSTSTTNSFDVLMTE